MCPALAARAGRRRLETVSSVGIDVRLRDERSCAEGREFPCRRESLCAGAFTTGREECQPLSSPAAFARAPPFTILSARPVTSAPRERRLEPDETNGRPRRRGSLRRPRPRLPARAARPVRGHGRRSLARLRRADRLLADRGEDLQAGEGFRGRDRQGLLLRREQLLDRRARRHAPRRARPFRRREEHRRPHPARTVDGRGRRRGRCEQV